MMIYTLNIFLWIMVTLSVGLVAVNFVTQGRPLFLRAEKIAIAFPLGLLLVSFQLFIQGVSHNRFHVGLCLAFWVAVWMLSLWTSRASKKSGGIRDDVLIPWMRTEKFFAAGILFQLGYTFFRALLIPLSDFDAIMNFGIKAKIFYYANTIPADFYQRFDGFLNNIEYPLMLPLSEVYFYLFTGHLDDWGVKIIFPLVYACVLVYFYAVVERNAGRPTALLFTFFLSSVPTVHNYGNNGFADIIMADCVLISGVMFWFWTKNADRASLILSCLFAVGALWVKAEGIILMGALFFIMLFYTPRFWRQAAVFNGAIILFAAGYVLHKHANQLVINNHIVQADFQGTVAFAANHLKRILAIAYEYQSQWFDIKSWNLIWPICFVLIGARWKKIVTKEYRSLGAIIFLLSLGYSAIYFFIPNDIFLWMLRKSAFRFFLHVLPLVAVLSAVLFGRRWGNLIKEL